MSATEAGEHLLLWVTPRDDIATPAIRGNGGGWVLRYWDGAIHDGPVNLCLSEKADPVLLAGWVSGQFGYPVTLTRTGRPRWWVPPRFRDCGETSVYAVMSAVPFSRG